MAEDTWFSRAVPLMETIADLEGTMLPVRISELAQQTGLDAEDVVTELERLMEAGYVSGDLRRYLGPDVGMWNLVATRLTGRGARVVGRWPSDDTYDALLAAVEARLAEAEDEAQRGRWRRLRDALTEMGKAAVVGLAVEAAKHGAFGH